MSLLFIIMSFADRKCDCCQMNFGSSCTMVSLSIYKFIPPGIKDYYRTQSLDLCNTCYLTELYKQTDAYKLWSEEMDFIELNGFDKFEDTFADRDDRFIRHN